MKRLVALSVLAVLLVGCQNPPIGTDPFLRTRVPPEGSGAMAPGVVAPGAVAPGVSPIVTPPPITSPSTTVPAVPVTPLRPLTPSPGVEATPAAGTFNFQQTSIDRRKAVSTNLPRSRVGSKPAVRRAVSAEEPKAEFADRTTTPASTARIVGETSEPLSNGAETTFWQPQLAANDEPATKVDADRGQAIRVSYLDAQGDDDSTAASTENLKSDRVDRASAVAPRTAAAANTLDASSNKSTLRIVSSQGSADGAGQATEPSDESSTEPAAAQPWRLAAVESGASDSQPTSVAFRDTTPAASGKASTTDSTRPVYGHETDYGWLRGRLEHSATSGTWKLRYIPIDGRTDEFGGSVVLNNSTLLEKYKSGQLLTVHGRLAGDSAAGRGFAPAYQVERIEPSLP